MRHRFRICSCLFLVCFCAVKCQAAQYKVTDLGTLGGASSEGQAINVSGQVTGWSYKNEHTNIHAFLYNGTLHDLGTLGGTESFGWGINASGTVTGESDTMGGETHAFMYDGTLHDLGTLGGTISVGSGINSTGMVVGHSYLPANSAEHAFLYDGTMHDLGTLPGGTGSVASAINNTGQITGSAYLPGDVSHAFLYDGAMHDLGTLGGTTSHGSAINSSGKITGDSNTLGDLATHAFLYNGTLHDLGTLGGTNSYGSGINASGQIVGRSDNSNANVSAFLYTSGSGMVDLNSLIDPLSGWLLINANAINDAGQVTGSGVFDGGFHAFLLTPVVPEPSTLALVESGLLLVAFVVICRRGAEPPHKVDDQHRVRWQTNGFSLIYSLLRDTRKKPPVLTWAASLANSCL